MEKFKALLVSNSTVKTVEDFMESQNEMINPLVLILSEETGDLVEHFKIVAEDDEDLNLMYQYKLFYTSSIPEGEMISKYGATFYGVDQNLYKEKERAAATDVLLNDVI